MARLGGVALTALRTERVLKPTARLLARYGPDANMVDLRLVLAGDCLRLHDGPPSMPNRCGVGCSEMAAKAPLTADLTAALADALRPWWRKLL